MDIGSFRKRIAWRFRRFILPDQASSVQINAQSNVVVAGLFRTASGIGESARLCAHALKRVGFDPIQLDLSKIFDQVDMDYANFVTELPKDGGLLILHLNAPETERALFELQIRRPHKWKIIGYWAWETMNLPENWLEATRLLDEIWVPSEFTAKSVKKSVNLPIRVQPHFVDIPKPIKGVTPHDKTVCLVMADGKSSLTRKNLVGAISIFKQACENNDNVELIVKTRNLLENSYAASKVHDLVDADPRIHLIDATLSEPDRDQLIDRSDILISPHRAEGFGLTLAEAMVRGKTVIATAWSGNMTFMNEDSALLIPYQLKRLSDPSCIYVGVNGELWADPDLQTAARLLRQAIENPEMRTLLGLRARDQIQKALSAETWLNSLESVYS